MTTIVRREMLAMWDKLGLRTGFGPKRVFVLGVASLLSHTLSPCVTSLSHT